MNKHLRAFFGVAAIATATQALIISLGIIPPFESSAKGADQPSKGAEQQSVPQSQSTEGASKATAQFTARGHGSSRVRVMIDPGHGGEDDGAVVKGAREKDITLEVGLELRRILNADPRFVVLMTRDHDRYVSLSDRSQKASEEKADVFVSIHCNSSTEPKAHGTEFYFENQVPTDEESMQLAAKENNVKVEAGDKGTAENSDVSNILSDLVHNEHLFMSQQLAQNLLESFQKEFNVRTRAIRQAPFRVLLVTMPATLVELGFITNHAEEKWLTSVDTQKKMARSLYDGLKRFKEKLDKARNSTVK